MKTFVLGVPIDVVTKKEALDRVLSYINEPERRCRLVITPNPEIIMEAKNNGEFNHIINNADLVVPDGIGVVLASKLNKVKIKERVTGYDLVEATLEKAGNISVYLLGAKPGVAKRGAENIQKRFGKVTVAGCHDGFFDKAEEEKILWDIAEKQPDILIVGMGCPRQEKWIYNNRDRLPVHVGFAVGGTIDVLAGEAKLAPDIFRKSGFEWLYRLIKQPSRFFRMLKLPQFVLIVLIDKIRPKKKS